MNVLTIDPGIGVVRHADAGYEQAKKVARENKLKIANARLIDTRVMELVGLAGFEPATHTAGKEPVPYPSRWQSGVQPHISRVLHQAELQAHFAGASFQVCLKTCL